MNVVDGVTSPSSSAAATVTTFNVDPGSYVSVTVRLRTVSGDFSIGARLDAAANFEAESISGTLHVDLSGAPSAQFDAQSLSGDIRNCKGPEAVKAQHGPGSRLTFATGDGNAQVHLSSNSGDLGLCVK